MKFNIVAAVILALFVGLFAVAQATQPTYQPLDLTLPEEVKPGQSLPPGSACHWRGYAGEAPYCNNGPYYLLLDRDTWKITNTSTYVFESGLLLGDLVLSRGQPSGYRAWGLTRVVAWPGFYVFATGKVFSPANRVTVLAWGTPPAVDEWEGFQNR